MNFQSRHFVSQFYKCSPSLLWNVLIQDLWLLPCCPMSVNLKGRDKWQQKHRLAWMENSLLSCRSLGPERSDWSSPWIQKIINSWTCGSHWQISQSHITLSSPSTLSDVTELQQVLPMSDFWPLSFLIGFSLGFHLSFYFKSHVTTWEKHGNISPLCTMATQVQRKLFHTYISSLKLVWINVVWYYTVSSLLAAINVYSVRSEYVPANKGYFWCKFSMFTCSVWIVNTLPVTQIRRNTQT